MRILGIDPGTRITGWLGDEDDIRGVSNLAYGGNVFLSPPKWEELIVGK